MKAKTKEEKFLIAVYEAAVAAGSPEAEVDRYAIGQKLGLHPRGIDTICQVLSQANFLKKRGTDMVTLTSNGIRLFEELKSS